MSRTTFALLVVMAASLPSGAALAQGGCFQRTGQTPSRAQTLVGLHDVIRLSPRCTYTLSEDADGQPAGALAGRDTDFLELYQQLLGSQRRSGDPRVILAHPTRGRERPVETLILRYCAHYLIEEQLGFEVEPASSDGNLRVGRVAQAACDAGALELRAVSGADHPGLYRGEVGHRLAVGEDRLSLPAGDWSLYAARPGGAVGLRVGVFRSQRVVTPLSNHLRTAHRAAGGEGDAPPALFAARWDAAAPGLLLHPTAHATGAELLWPELRTAADAGFLWLAQPVHDAPPVVLGAVQLEATDPAALRLPDSVVRDRMRARYGRAGDALAPSTDDWRSLFDDLALCLTPSYREPRLASIGTAVPDAGACAVLGRMTVFAEADAARPSAPRYCLQHAMQEMRADGARQRFGDDEPECFALPAPGASGAVPHRMAVAGDRFTLSGDGLCVLVDGVVSQPNDEGVHVLQSGLLEVRESGGVDCTSRQAIGRLRLSVIDPEHEWHPVGFFAGAHLSDLECPDDPERSCPWRALAHDESDVFAFVEARHELDFSLSTSPQVAAIENRDPSRPVQLTVDVPVLSGVSGRFEGAAEPAVVAYVSRSEVCPSEHTYQELREHPPLDVDSLLVDATFNVFLLSVEALDAPPTCLARASFRSRSSRALVSETAGDFLGMELGLLGDTQAVVFVNDPVALGLALPVVWFRLTPGIRWLALEVAGNLVMSAAFDPAELSRVGVALSWALSLGIPDYLPRILSVGGMLHGAAETNSVDNPIVSFYVGLNLATLIDLAGGR